MMVAERFKRHGRVRVSSDGRHLVHADGTPFFFLADTAWNGALLSTEDEWEAYLEDRAAKGFTAIQFITHAPWTAALTDGEGRVAIENGRINERAFDRIERRMERINARGMLAVPVLAWAANFGKSARLNLGQTMDAEALVKFVGYQVERFGRFQVMWALAGDGKYDWLRARKWRRVGRSVFGARKERAPVTLHPQGFTWPWDGLGDEAWVDVLGYQSGHTEESKWMRWHHSGPLATSWRKRAKPVINLEPVYEGIAPGRAAFDDYAVRRAVYWSLLCAPTAGVAYGAHGVWSWTREAGEVLNHIGLGEARPWREAMGFAGSGDMGRVGEILGGVEWWRLRPAQELIRAQPYGDDPARHVAVGASEKGDLVVAYLPAGGRVELEERVARLRYRWICPRSGRNIESGGVLEAPDGGDWVLVGMG